MLPSLTSPLLEKRKGKKLNKAFIEQLMNIDHRMIRVKAECEYDHDLTQKFIRDNLMALNEFVWPGDPVRELMSRKDFVQAPRVEVDTNAHLYNYERSRERRMIPGIYDHILTKRKGQDLYLILNGVETIITERDVLP